MYTIYITEAVGIYKSPPRWEEAEGSHRHGVHFQTTPHGFYHTGISSRGDPGTLGAGGQGDITGGRVGQHAKEQEGEFQPSERKCHKTKDNGD